ncbi:integrase [Archaeoglobus neptunius]|uniref:integrase n=1 Tax=Archaeoglobus neptunius TaxID=2798580 RepID=UPI00192895B3
MGSPGFEPGLKRVTGFNFPTEFLDELKKTKIDQGYKVIQKAIAHGRVNAETIRKWHFNFMIIENDVPESIADFIQGRRPDNLFIRYVCSTLQTNPTSS